MPRSLFAFVFALVALTAAAGPLRALPAGAAGLTSILVHTGGAAVGSWAVDPGPAQGFRTAISTTSAAIDTSGVQQPAPQAVYQTSRYGSNFTYVFRGLAPGAVYEVRLHFAEPTATAAGQRVFNVSINGARAASNVDVFSLAGAQNRAVTLIESATPYYGQIWITFAGENRGNAIISGIEIQQPLLIRTGGGAISTWSRDPGPASGSTGTYITRAGIDLSGVTQPAPQAVYQSTRYGNAFTYTLGGLVPGGAYSVRLHFAEPYVTGVGQRLFNVTINGAPAAWNLDVFALAGAQNRAVTRSFGTNANAAGQITIAFAGVNGVQAEVSGIEIAPAGFVAPSATDNTTSHYDAYRTSWNPQEQILTNANVAPATFGLLGAVSVDGSVDAQPLVATGVNIPTLGSRHDLLVVGTAKDSVYAFDANSGALIWQRSLIGSGERSLTTADVGGCKDSLPDIGIMGTPVIDRASNALYVDVPTYSTVTSSYHHRIHALALSSGVDLLTPAEVTGSIPGTGQTFNPQFQRQRAGLTLANGAVYVAFASFCDIEVNSANNPVVGWLFGFNEATLAPLSTGDAFSNSLLDAIWQGGVAPAADGSGNIYFTTGNGSYDGSINFDNSLLKVGPGLNRLDSFTTRNHVSETQSDFDLSSSGPVLVPDQPGAYPHLVLHEGKVPALRVLNRDSLGGYSGGPAEPEATLSYGYRTGCDPTVSANCAAANAVQSQTGGVWGGIAYYTGPGAQQYVVVADAATYAHSFALNTGSSVTLVPAAQSTVVLPSEGGATPLVTSNGTLPGSAVVWLINRADPTFALQAYDAATMNLLYSTNAGQWTSGSGDSMLVPTVANGRVYVPSQVLSASGTLTGGQVAVYGLTGTTSSDLVRAPAARSIGTSPATAIRLAGPVVFGPGSHVIARAPVARVAPSPQVRAVHQFYGVLRRNDNGSMVFALRSGRDVTVDARAVLAAGYYSRDIAVGKVCLVATGAPAAGTGTLTALSIIHMRRSVQGLPADR